MPEDGDQPPPGGPGPEVGGQEADGGEPPFADDTVALGGGTPATQEDMGQALAPGSMEEAAGGDSPTVGEGQGPTEGQAEAAGGQGQGGEPPELPSNAAAEQEERMGVMEKNMQELAETMTQTMNQFASFVQGQMGPPGDNEGSITLANNNNSMNHSNISIAGMDAGGVTQGDSGSRPTMEGSFLTTVGAAADMFAGERGATTRYASDEQVVQFLQDPDGYTRAMKALRGVKGFTKDSPEKDVRNQAREDKKKADKEAAEVGRQYIYDGRRDKVTRIDSAIRLRTIYLQKVPKKAGINARVALLSEWMRGSAQGNTWTRFETKFHDRQDEISFNQNDYEINQIDNKEAENVDAVLDSIEEENGNQRFQLMTDAIAEFFDELLLKDKAKADTRKKRYKDKWDKWEWRLLSTSPRDLWNTFDAQRADQIVDVPVTVQPELLDLRTGKKLEPRVRKENQDENMKTVTTKWYQTMWNSPQSAEFMERWKSSMLLTVDLDVKFENVDRILRYEHGRSRTSSNEYREHREWVIKRIQRHYEDEKEKLQKKEPKKNGNNKHKKKNGNGAGSSSASGPSGDTLNINAMQATQSQAERRAQMKSIRDATYEKFKSEFHFIKDDNYWDREVKPQVVKALKKLYESKRVTYPEAKNLMNAFFLCRLCWGPHLMKDHRRSDGFYEAVLEHEQGLVKSWNSKN